MLQLLSVLRTKPPPAQLLLCCVFGVGLVVGPFLLNAQIGAGDVINPKAQPFRAKCDSVADDYAALQAAIDAACTHNQALYIPPGGCKHGKPLVARCSINMFGIGGLSSRRDASSLGPLGYFGPDLLIESAGVAGLSTGPPLVGESGASFKIDHDNAVTINLRQTKSAELDGLRAFTAEGAFRLPNSAATITLIAYGGGVSKNGDALPPQGALDLDIRVEGGRLGAVLRINGTRHDLGQQPIAANVTHYVALTYDGSVIGLYCDGTRIATEPASGPVTQNVTDDVTIGVANQTGPEGALVGGSTEGTLIDSVRLSDMARYRGPMMPVPVNEFGNDSHTIALVNFDNNSPAGFTEVEHGGEPGYSVVERSKDARGGWAPFDGGVYVHDLWFQGGLWCWRCTYRSSFDNLFFQYGAVGLVLGGDSNEDIVNNLAVVKGGPQMRYGLLMATANGNRVNGAQIDTPVFPLVIQSAARVWMSDLLITPGAQFGVLTFGAAPSIRGLYFDEEDTKPPGFVASLVEEGNWAPSDISGLEIDNFAGPGGHPIILDNGMGASITAASMTNSGTIPVVYINGGASGGLKSPVILNNILHDATAPLTNVPALTIAFGDHANANVTVGGRVIEGGHIMLSGGKAPTVGSCGVNPSITPGAQDSAFEARGGAGVTSCVVTFGTAFGSKPVCTCNDETSSNPLKLTPSTGGLTIANLAAGDAFMCNCAGR